MQTLKLVTHGMSRVLLIIDYVIILLANSK
jgi:hypothetical protein